MSSDINDCGWHEVVNMQVFEKQRKQLKTLKV